MGDRGEVVGLRADRSGGLRLPGPAHVFRPPLGDPGAGERQTFQGKTGTELLHSLRSQGAELESSRHVPRPTYRDSYFVLPRARGKRKNWKCTRRFTFLFPRRSPWRKGSSTSCTAALRRCSPELSEGARKTTSGTPGAGCRSHPPTPSGSQASFSP